MLSLIFSKAANFDFFNLKNGNKDILKEINDTV